MSIKNVNTPTKAPRFCIMLQEIDRLFRFNELILRGDSRGKNSVLSETSHHKRQENESHWLGQIYHKREKGMGWQRTSPALSGTKANTASNCAWAIEALLFENGLILLQIKQTSQLEKRIYPSRYIKRNDTNAATPQAGIAARARSTIWILLSRPEWYWYQCYSIEC